MRIVMPLRELIDWHTYCYLPEHRSLEARAEMKAHGVRGGKGWPEEHMEAVEEAGFKKFEVVNAFKNLSKWGEGVALPLMPKDRLAVCREQALRP